MLLQITEFLSSFSNLVPAGKEVITITMFVTLSVVFLAAIKIISMILTRLAKKTKTTLDDEIIKHTKKAFYCVALWTSLYLAIFANYGELVIEGISLFDFYVIGIFVVAAILLNNLIDVGLVWYANEISPTKRSIKAKEVFPFVRNVVKILIYVAFAILILDKLGIEIAPLIAGLGIAGLAVALALQDTLSNFFAGIHILADKPFREGDYIRTDSGMEGHVTAIGWRTTKLTTLGRNDIIIPNAKLAQSIIMNYYTPEKAMGVLGEIGVSYKEDVEKVEKVILETLKSVQKKNPKMVQGAEPFARLDKFGDYALIFKYGYLVTSFEDQFDVLRDVNKELLRNFRKNKIEIPFPVRVIYSKKT